jgi:hypothetical protein
MTGQPRRKRWNGLLRHWLIYLALSSIAIAQPLLDLYGTNLTVFAAAKLSRLEIVAFLLVVVFLPSLICVAIESLVRLVQPRLVEATFRALGGVLGALFVMVVLRRVGIGADLLVVTAAVVALFAIAKWMMASVKALEWLRYLSAVALLVSALFAINTWELLFPKEIAISTASRDASQVKDLPPVLFLIFDESPLFAILKEDGTINAERFPGFAKLASKSTWYRNGTAVSQWTAQAVPAILTGKIPEKGQLPFYNQHPQNLFTLLSDTYPLNVYESVTELCPKNLCTSLTSVGETWSTSRFRTFMKDASVVYGHKSLPSGLRDKLPAIDEAWGGFGGDAFEAASDVAAAESARLGQFRALSKMGPLLQANLIGSLAEKMATDKGAGFYFGHALLPHRPWLATPDLRVSLNLPPLPGVEKDVTPAWEDGARTYLQRYLLQLGSVDTTILNAINTLEAANKWDEALVVVTSDHGISFEPNVEQRATDFNNPGQMEDLYRVPMFMKLPGQKTGVVSNCAITNIDLMPTLIDALQLKTDWTFDGVSRLNSCPDELARVVTTPQEKGTLSTNGDAAKARAKRYAQFVPTSGGVAGIAAIGKYASLIGSTIDTATLPEVGTFALDSPEQFDNVSIEPGAVIPGYVRGFTTLNEKLGDSDTGLFLIDGKVAGFMPELGGDGPGEKFFDVVLDPTQLTKGAHTVGIVLVSGPVETPKYRVLRKPD